MVQTKATPQVSTTSTTSSERSEQIRSTKERLRRGIGNTEEVFAEIEQFMRDEVASIANDAKNGRAVIPEVQFRDIASSSVPEETVMAISRRGCAVIRQTFPEKEARGWDSEIVDYLEQNNFAERYRSLPNHMPTRPDGEPLMYPIYWSKPQVKARQDERLNATRAFMNTMWKSTSEGKTWFDGTKEATYADKVRRRKPGDPYAGLVAHIDGGSDDRWRTEGYLQVYRHLYSGDWRTYDPWDGAYRTSSETYSLFRTFQGWTALSEMHPTDGVLHVVPIASAVIYILIRSLLADIPADDLLQRSSFHPTFELDRKFHGIFDAALVPIPKVRPGDTVWWHCDLIHSVPDGSARERWGNVMYIASAPVCEMNSAITRRQLPAFLSGTSPSKTVPSLEVNWKGRAAVDDLSPVGRKQMGLDPW